ncbi:MAG TPA: serine hydrolase [Thermoanaerobaculia bacterium]|jgi:CubicO group peptidase (beta-lactamase class C family)
MSRVRRLYPVACVLASWLAGCTSVPEARLATPSPSPAAVLEAELPRMMEEAGVPGLAIALLRDGRPVWHGAFGVRNADTGDPVTNQTVFEAASLSKPVFAYAVLRLAARGELDLDAPLWTTLPYSRLAHDERARAITARMALSHQTGLPNWGGPPMGDAPLQLESDPGGRWQYSGEGFVFLQQAVEKLTGLELDALVRREVFAPLGMTHSSFVWQDAYETATATGHERLGAAQEKSKPGAANAAASLHTTAADFARFVAAVLRGPDREVAERMLEAQVQVAGQDGADPPPELRWGLGWGLQDGAAGRAFWHWGDNGTFRCYVVAFPAGGDGLVYFTNSENGLSLARALVSRVLPGDAHAAVSWIDYEAYDAPARKLVFALERAFLHEGRDAGLALYRRLAREQPDALAPPVAGRVAQTLADRDRSDDAIALLTANVERFPDVAAALHDLGQALLDAGRLEEALAAYRRVLELAPDDERAPARIAWAELGLASHPPALPEDALRRLAGSYGPRQVTFEEGRLRYVRRGGSGTPYWLAPLTQDTFALEGLPSFRLRFVSGDEGRIVKVEGLYSEGRTDESPRDP